MADVRQTLRTTPPEHVLLETWTMPALDDLDAGQKNRFHMLRECIKYYVAGGKISKYLRERGVHREIFYRAFDRCVTLDSRGKPYGWVGLLPFIELKPRQRKAPLGTYDGQKSGLSGALELFLRKNKDVREQLQAFLNTNAKRKPGGEAGIRHKSVHMEFLRLCEIEDPDHEQWPFTSRRRGAGAIRTFVTQYMRSNYDRIVATQYGDKAATKAKAGTGYESRLAASMPFDLVELDEHTAGFIGSVKIETPEGSRILDAGRVTILLMADRYTGWILSFKVIYREAANSDDVLDVLHAATVGEPGYAHKKPHEEALRPLVDLDLKFGWCGFNALLLDNALIHLAQGVVSRVRILCGCDANFGPVHTPARRQLVERINNALERSGFKRLRTTTGSGPLDPKKQDPEKEARRCMLTDVEIVHLVAKLVQKYNTDIGKHNLGASPYERLSSLIAGEDHTRYLFPFLPPLQAGEADLSRLVIRVPVRGNEKTGRRPYFTYLEADYTSPEIARDWGLVGKQIVLHVTRSNVRKVPAFFDGRPLGVCLANGRWRSSDCSIDLRRYINKLVREGYIQNDFKGDVVAAFSAQLGKDVVSKRGDRKPVKTSVRQLADNAVRREEGNFVDDDDSSHGAEQAVNDLLDRASETDSEDFQKWDDIGAFNGGGHEY